VERQPSTPTPVRATRANASRARQHSSSLPALQTLLRETIDFLLAAGLSRSEAARELESQRKRLLKCEQGARLRTEAEVRVQKLERQHLEASGVVHDWHRSEEYTDQQGEPISLTEEELFDLMRKRFAAEKVESTLSWMLHNKVVRRLKDKRFELVEGRPVLLRGTVRQSQALARAAVIVPQYLQVVLRNAATADLDLREVERDAHILMLPEKYVPLWRSLVRERVQAFLESMDNWLEDHASNDDAEPVREVSIHVHSYIGDSRGPKAR
jgi:hypothetical protein